MILYEMIHWNSPSVNELIFFFRIVKISYDIWYYREFFIRFSNNMIYNNYLHFIDTYVWYVLPT